MGGKCAICLTGDAGFNPYACFTAASVLAHPENEGFDVFLCSDELSAAEKAFMEDLSIRPVLIDPSEVAIKWGPSQLGLPRASFYRLYVDRFLPDGYDRVIYLDGDIYAAGSLQALAGLDLEGKTAAAVRGLGLEGCRSEEERRRLQDYWRSIGIRRDTSFNTGLLVIDLARWREGDFGARAVAEAMQQREIDDEEALNIVLQDDWIEVSSRWNFPSSRLCLDVETSLEPVIYHYMHSPKPWHRSWPHDPLHRRRYKEFFAHSPWPNAARGWPPNFQLRRHLRERVKQLTRKVLHLGGRVAYQDSGRLGRWRRKVVAEVHNEGVERSRFADHRQGLTDLSRID